MRRYLMLVFVLTIVLGTFRRVPAAEHRVVSPDGALAAVVSEDGGLSYRVDVGGRALLTRSRLGLKFEGDVALGPRAKIQGVEASEHDGTWENRFGKRRTVRDRWRQARFDLLEPGEPSRRFGLIVRVFDDGVALRYELPEASRLGRFTLVGEITEFAFAGDYRCWAGEPSNCAENQYPQRTLAAIPSRDPAQPQEPYRSVLPLLVEAPQCYAAVAESDLRDWAGMFVAGTGTPTVAVSLAPRNDGRGCVVSEAPRQSPWRVVMVGRTAAKLVESDLIANLAEPCRLADASWIQPGIAAWDPWWTGINPHMPEHKGVWSRGDTRAHKEYIDLAAEMGWPYQLVDWFWYENMTSYDITLNLGGKNPPRPPVDFAKTVPHVDMPALLAHAKGRGVRLLIWLHSYDLDRYGVEKACALFSAWGVAGLKIDFMNSDSQETVKWYEDVIATAARYKLTVDFHGAYKATGLARTYPNYITQEGVLGNEYNKLDGDKCTPLHTVTLPFTRGLLGPMDFTPGGFLNVPPSQFKITQPAVVMGTRARQLAMPVVYESPLTVLCDSPANYRGQPGIEFYRGLPTVWDETVVLSAEVARHIVIARRSEGRWWLAAINGDQPVALRVPLSFLGPGAWTLRSFADTPRSAERPTDVAETTRPVASGETLELRLAPAGGYAAVATPAQHKAVRPNIVFFIADDMGYGDLGCYGQTKIRTPRIDRMAAEGLRFTQHYAGNAVCAPSRCVLMTGKHPGHAHVRNNRGYKPEGQEPLPADAIALPSLLKASGYATGGFGKWGLGGPGTSGDPLKQGFVRWFGYNCQGVAHNFYPTYLWDDDRKLAIANPAFPAHDTFKPGEDANDPKSYRRFQGSHYSADLIAEQARKFIRDHKDKPFFCYVPTTVPHLALQVPDDSLQEYVGQWDDPPYQGGRGYLPHFAPRAAYAAMITRMDREVGRIMDLVEELGLDENTIFVFTSDNGPLNGVHQGLAGTDAIFFNSSGGLRDGKGTLYEGGIRVPAIVRWKGRIRPGTTCDRVTGFEDWLPTLLELAGLADQIPAGIDGIGFVPALHGRPQPERPFLYREFPAYGGQQCIRAGRWKLVRQNLLVNRRDAAKGRRPTLELYDLAADPREQHDVAAEHPDVVARLAQLMKEQHAPSKEFPFAALDE